MAATWPLIGKAFDGFKMCTLRAAGREFEVDKFLAKSPIKPLVVYHAGDLKFSTKPDGPRLTRSGFNRLIITPLESESSRRGRLAKVQARALRRHAETFRRLAK